MKSIRCLFFVVILFLSYSCGGTKKIQSSTTGSSSTKTKLEIPGLPPKAVGDFISGGVGKYLNTGKNTPDDLIKAAKKYLGTKHCMGGTDKKCIDCSGLLFASFRDLGITIARTAEDQARYGTIINSKSSLKKGDLVFFVRTYKTSRLITHAGIYLGDGKFIHTSSSKGVTIGDIYDKYYWNDKFAFGTRVFL